MFVTDGTIDATSTSEGTYNSFVQSQASALTGYFPSGTSWSAVTATYDGTTYTSVPANAPVYSGVPLYNTAGQVILPDSGQLYVLADGLSGGAVEGVSPIFDQSGNAFPALVWTGFTWPPSYPQEALGGEPYTNSYCCLGESSANNSGFGLWWTFGDPETVQHSLFGLSSLITVPTPVKAPYTWNASGWLGDWNTAGNWAGGIVPNGAGTVATFDNTVAGATAAITNVPVTLGVLNIASSSRIDIAGVDQGALAMQAATTGSSAQIYVSGGTLDKINLPLSFNSPTAINVAVGSTLEIGNPVNLNGQTVTLSGGGTLQCDVNFSASSGTLRANAGAVAIGAEAIVSPALLDIAGNAQLSGAGTIQGDVIYESSAASLFAGAIAGAGSSLVLNANGGSLTLTGSNTYGGGTEVLSGTLIAAGDESLPDGGSLTVGAGAAAMLDAPSLAASPAVAAVPEPSTIALFGAGLMGLMAYGWRRRRRVA
jgi:autotransporter-associated beta strand protein